jgi:putative oxidoreductase
MTLLWHKISNSHNDFVQQLNHLEQALLLGIRLYMAWVFFKAGLVKIGDWDSTLLLFEYEYAVPLLSYEVAAYLGTFGELFFPVLLALGLLTRFSALGLSVVNIVAVMSYADMPAAAYNVHVIWGILLLVVMFRGAGWCSCDRFIQLT